MKQSTFLFILFIVFGILALMVLFFGSGCNPAGMTDPNIPLIDPNQVDALIETGKVVQKIGVVWGRPELYGLGVLVTTIGTAISVVLVTNRKKKVKGVTK